MWRCRHRSPSRSPTSVRRRRISRSPSARIVGRSHRGVRAQHRYRSARQAHVVLSVNAGVDSSSATAKIAETTIPVGSQESADVVLRRAATGVGRRWPSTIEQGAAADNARYLVLDANARPTMLIVTANGDLSREAFLRSAGARRRSAPTAAAYDVEGVGGADLQKWDQPRFDRALCGHPAVDPRPRSSRAIAHRRVREEGRRSPDRGRRGRRRRGAFRKRSAVRKSSIAPPVARSTGARPGTLAPADVRHPVFHAFARSIVARPGEVQADRDDSGGRMSRRWRGLRPGKRRSSTASSRQGRAIVLRLRPRQSVE